MTDVTSDFVSGPIGDKAVSAIWQLSLALVFKMIVTVFTFGIKVLLAVAYTQCIWLQLGLRPPNTDR